MPRALHRPPTSLYVDRTRVSGRSSRRKGKEGELEVVRALAAHGLEVRRTPNSGGLAWRGDLQGLDGYCIEVKRCETLAIPAWLRQAYAAASGGEVPVVIFRRSAPGNGRERNPDSEWHALLPLNEWARLVARELSDDGAILITPAAGD